MACQNGTRTKLVDTTGLFRKLGPRGLQTTIAVKRIGMKVKKYNRQNGRSGKNPNMVATLRLGL